MSATDLAHDDDDNDYEEEEEEDDNENQIITSLIFLSFAFNYPKCVLGANTAEWPQTNAGGTSNLSFFVCQRENS